MGEGRVSTVLRNPSFRGPGIFVEVADAGMIGCEPVVAGELMRE